MLVLNKKIMSYGGIMALTASCVMSGQANAASKKSSTASCGTTTNYTIPAPVRPAYLRPVGTQTFTLNGTTMNMTPDLQDMFAAVVTQNSTFQPANSPSNVCGSHIEIQANIVDFELNVASAGATIGYTPAAGSGTITNINGTANVQVGSIEMAFQAMVCSNAVSPSTAESCQVVVSSTATHLTAGVNLSFNANFSTITTTASFIFNTELASIIQSIMTNGINQVVASAKYSMLPWQATVQEYIPATGTFIFDEGTQSSIGSNQAFVVLAPAASTSTSTGACNAYAPIAYAHTTANVPVSSTAVVDTIIGRTVQAGDVVMINTTPNH